MQGTVDILMAVLEKDVIGEPQTSLFVKTTSESRSQLQQAASKPPFRFRLVKSHQLNVHTDVDPHTAHAREQKVPARAVHGPGSGLLVDVVFSCHGRDWFPCPTNILMQQTFPKQAS